MEKLLKYKNNPSNTGQWDFHSTIFHIPKFQAPSPLSGDTHLDIIQKATIWSLELGNMKSLWKKLKESEKNHQNVRKTLALPRNGLSILPTIKNHHINLHNWKTSENYENNQHYAARA